MSAESNANAVSKNNFFEVDLLTRVVYNMADNPLFQLFFCTPSFQYWRPQGQHDHEADWYCLAQLFVQFVRQPQARHIFGKARLGAAAFVGNMLGQCRYLHRDSAAPNIQTYVGRILAF